VAVRKREHHDFSRRGLLLVGAKKGPADIFTGVSEIWHKNSKNKLLRIS